METRANYAIIGLFTLAVIAAGFGFVFWFSGTERGARKSPYKVEFAGSVAGLNKGAPVLFNGIRVGDVTDVYFVAARPQQAFAKIELQPDVPVKTDTKANLDVQLLSGVAVISLSGGSAEAPTLEKRPEDDLPTILAERGGLGSIIETAKSTAERANVLIENLNGIVTDNRESLNRSVRNVETFSNALSANAPQIQRALASIGQAAERVGPVAAKLETLTDETTAFVRSVDRNRIARIIENVDTTMQTVGESRTRIAEVLRDASSFAKGLSDSVPDLRKMAGDASRVVAAVDPAKIGNIVNSTDRAAARLEGLTVDAQTVVKAVDPNRVSRIVQNVDGVMQTVGDSRAKVADILQDGSVLVRRLADTAPQLQQVLSDAGRVVAAIDPVKVNGIVDNTSRFTTALGNSSRDIENTARNANSLSAKLDAAAGRIDGVLKAAENFLGSAAGQEGKSTFASIRDAMDRFGAASDNLNRRATEIAQGVTRFTGSGAKQVEGVAVDARRTINTVGRAAQNLERNPSSVIFGGRPSLPEYNGR